MSIKILLADDSITIQKVISIIFGGDEYALTVVNNGKAAIEKAREVPPDVLLIDVLMPEMSGYEVCEAIRAIPELSAKPILLLTGTFEPFDEVRAKSCGADDFLAKPFESQQIVNKVKELLEHGASRAAAASQTGMIPEPFPMDNPFAPSVESPSNEIKTDDIWGAFTATPESVSTPSEMATPEQLPEPDVFAIISEELNVQPEPPVSVDTVPDGSGSDWIPVEEHTFEFVEESLAEIPASSIIGLESPDQEISFGDISFSEEMQPESAEIADTPALNVQPLSEDTPSEPSPFLDEALIPDFNEPAAPVFDAVPSYEEPEKMVVAAPTFTEPDIAAVAVPTFDEPKTEFVAAPVSDEPKSAVISKSDDTLPVMMTEAQLRAAIAGVSQEVIERIVWEVVPDLAETLIKEAIRKIKEGL